MISLPIGVLHVVDFRLGYVRIHVTPHFYLARSLVRGGQPNSSSAFYRSYRTDQFAFTEEQAKVDEQYFTMKVLNPRLDLPLSFGVKHGRFVVFDGFHRLAIAAAYGAKRVSAIVK